jgi:gamma-butyrobetaine dioxygenase
MAITPDFDSYPVEFTIVGAVVKPGWVEVVWSDSRVSRFHNIWLRDNCACARCVHQGTKEQTFELVSVSPEIHPTRVSINASGSLALVWSEDGHPSEFHPGWLRANCYSNEARAERVITKTTWDGDTWSVPPTFDGLAVLSDDAVLYEWLIALRTYGATRLRNVPCTDDAIGDVVARIGIVRETNFGVLWDVWSEPNPVSNANTALPLPPHVDLPTREYQPGLQFLHCLENEAIGGDSILVDGFRIAELLREQYPLDYHTLTTISWDWANKAITTDYRWRSPIIVTASDGTVTEVRVGNWLRAPLDIAFEEVEVAYAAYRRLFEMTYRTDLQVRFRFEPGDLIAFDNRRALHARSEFTDVGGRRHLRGCYTERDEMHSRLRMLERTMREGRVAQQGSALR